MTDILNSMTAHIANPIRGKLAMLPWLLLALTACNVDRPGNKPADEPHLNVRYFVAGRPVTLIDGRAEAPAAPGSATNELTRYLGHDLRHDIDGDGREDVVFLLTQETGGSGTHFYIVAAVNRPGGWLGSNALLLGDRIAPQTVEAGAGRQVIVNFADRAPGEPFTTPPLQGKTLRLEFEPETLDFSVIAEDYPGTADPGTMHLAMRRWVWLGLVDADSAMPANAAEFTLAFRDDGRFDAATDCNRVSGRYAAQGNALSFSDFATTRMYCEGSQEAIFLKLLGDVAGFEFTGRGQLVLTFRERSGSMTFH